MKLSHKIIGVLLAAGMTLSAVPFTVRALDSADDNMNMFENSDFIEKEQPELSEQTKQLISLYKRDPSMENYLALRNEVIFNYDAVLDRKEAKLASLKEETAGKPGGLAKVAEMEEIVQEMYATYWNRINSSMLRFTDSRLLQWKIADAYKYDYIPVMGAGNSVYVARTQVTNADYYKFVEATGHAAPQNWINGKYAEGEDDYPVNYVSLYDAEAYCNWLTLLDGENVYRLPNESEWELAAGHMPKDADFNCGVNDGRTPVEQYAKVTRGAHGAVDFWGNVWEWTTTTREDTDEETFGVKGGSWKSARTDCRTEYRKEGRTAENGYDDVGFRVFKILNGEEPEQKVELATLPAPEVTAVKVDEKTAEISWKAVETAVEYQLFEYNETTGLIAMLETTDGLHYSVIREGGFDNLAYIVQPISYTAICDNVSAEFAVKPKEKASEIKVLEAFVKLSSEKITLSWEAEDGAACYFVYKLNAKTGNLSGGRKIEGATECSFRLKEGTEYIFVVTTTAIEQRKAYGGEISAASLA